MNRRTPGVIALAGSVLVGACAQKTPAAGPAASQVPMEAVAEATAPAGATESDLARYEGTYEMTSGTRKFDLRVFVLDGQLWAQPPGARGTALRHERDHVFVTAVDPDVRMAFTIQNGRAEAVSMVRPSGSIEGKRKP